MPAFELFNRAGLAASNSEARRLIRGGGARINDAVVDDETPLVRLADLGPAGRAQAQRRPQAPRPRPATVGRTPQRRTCGAVLAGLDPAIHAFLDVDARHKAAQGRA